MIRLLFLLFLFYAQGDGRDGGESHGTSILYQEIFTV